MRCLPLLLLPTLLSVVRRPHPSRRTTPYSDTPRYSTRKLDINDAESSRQLVDKRYVSLQAVASCAEEGCQVR